MRGSKGVLKSRIVLSIFLTLIIITSLVLVNVQTASAVQLSILGLPPSVCRGSTFTFEARIDINSGELVPFTNISLNISGPGNVYALFYANDSIISKTPQIISVHLLTEPPYYGYGYTYGYGYGYQSGVRGNHSWYWDWDYGYGYYGPPSKSIQLRYQIMISIIDMPAGDYIARLRANLPASDYFLSGETTITVMSCGGGGGTAPTESPTPTATPTSTAAATPTVTPTATPTGTPTGTPTPHEVNYNLLGSTGTWHMNSNGVLQEDGNASSPDGDVNVHIPSGAVVLGPDGQPIDDFMVSEVDPLPDPPEGGHVLAAFDFEPNGATFNPGIEITIAFNPSEVAEGEEVVIAFLNEDTGDWEFITGVVNADGTATFTVNHLSIYAVLAVLEGTVPTPTAAPAHHDKDEGLDTWVWIVAVIMGLLLLVELIAIIARLTRKDGAKLQKGKRPKKRKQGKDNVRLQKGARPKKRL